MKLPDAYFALLKFSNGGEGPLPVQPCNCCLYPAEVVTKNIRERSFEEFFSEFLVIGSNGGGEFVAFDVREKPPWPIVALDMTNCNLDESVQIVASSFQDFLGLLGVSEE